ncbi:exported hypothetical protein [Candidatus Sulfopaludibacter sp. SbA3]|nr:exported hypothetical protein [Candidatus Sulfopaludibacter sp. SbA3]
MKNRRLVAPAISAPVALADRRQRKRAAIEMKMGEILEGSAGLRRDRGSGFSRESADEAKARPAG